MIGEARREGIDIVIPNYNGRKMLKICLDSLKRQTYRRFTTIVVDNGSTDGSQTFLSEHYPDVHIVSLPENRGFSSAVNEGIAFGNREWVLLLNNDVEVDANCLAHLAKRCFPQHAYAMFALKMLDFAQRATLDGAGDGILRGGVGYRLGTMEMDGPDYALRREVFGACAGAALYRRSLFDRIGLFDEDFFAYLEDVDLNLRAVRAGYRCLYEPTAVVYHVGSATTGSKINRFTVKLSTRNNLFVILKHYSPAMVLRFLPAMLIYQFFWLLFVIKKGQGIGYLAGMFSCPLYFRAMRKKGRDIARQSVLSEKALVEKIIESEGRVLSSIMARRKQHNKNNLLLHVYRRLFC